MARLDAARSRSRGVCQRKNAAQTRHETRAWHIQAVQKAAIRLLRTPAEWDEVSEGVRSARAVRGRGRGRLGRAENHREQGETPCLQRWDSDRALALAGDRRQGGGTLLKRSRARLCFDVTPHVNLTYEPMNLMGLPCL